MNDIAEIFASKTAKSWMKRDGRAEIKTAHVPVVWLPLAKSADLRAAIAAGTVRLVTLPSVRDASKTVTYVAKV